MSPTTERHESFPYGIPPHGYRLPGGIRLGPVRLQVADLDRSAEYYRRILGLRARERPGGRVDLEPQGEARPLIELHHREGAAPVPKRGRLGLFHFAVLLPNREALGRLAAHLTREGEPMGASHHRVSEALYLRDPDGLGVEVYADRPRSDWKRDGRQLIMATDPLDLDELVRAGGSEPWTGAPEGTTMGHVHLHVGDLRQAEAFYHEALGLDKVVWSYPGALFLSAGGYHHHLGVNTWAREARPPSQDEAQLLEWEIRLPSTSDVEEVRESLRSKGYSVEDSDSKIRVRDPWGTALRLLPQAADQTHTKVGHTDEEG